MLSSNPARWQFFCFDDAKLQRFAESCNIFMAFPIKKWLLLDVNQAIVCANKH